MTEVASGFITLIPTFKGGAKTIQNDLDAVADKAGKSAGGKAGKSMGGGLVAGLKGLAGPLTAAFAAPIIIGGLNSLADRASDLNETVNKSQAIFGKQAAEMDKWSKSAAKTLGLSRSAALDAAAGFGDMFSQIGFTGKAAASMSKQVVQAAADLGSFSNLETADVSDRIAAAFRGEYDSLQAVIPNINAARVESVALAKTGKKTAKELTAQEKAAAVLAIVQKDGARAMGDFARTSNGAANAAKIQAARMEDLKTRAGQVVLPLKKAAIDGLGLLLDGLEKAGPFVGKAIDWFKGLFTQVGSGSGRFQSLVAGVQAFVTGMQTRLAPLMPQVRQIFATIGQIVSTYMDYVRTVIQRVTAIIGFIWTRWGTNIMDYIAKVFGAILTIAGGVLKVVAGVIKTVTSLIKGDWSGAWDGIKQIFAGVWQAIKGILSLALTAIKGLLSGAWAVIKLGVSSAWSGIKTAISTAIGNIVTVVKGIPGKILGALGDLNRLLYDAGVKLIQGLINGITDKVEDVGRAMTKVTDKIAGFFHGSPVKEGPLKQHGWNQNRPGRMLAQSLADGMNAGRNTVALASRSLAGSVASPGAGIGSGLTGSGGRFSSSDAQLIASAVERARLTATISAGSMDAAMGGALR